MPLETIILEVAGVRSPVRTGGPSTSREAVVFLHGNPGSGEDWEELGSAVSQFARVIAPDMPGFGRAGKPDDFRYTVPGYAEHLGALLERLEVSRAHLVMHDFGGPWGLQWAVRHGDAVASVTLINAGVFVGYRWHWAARLWRTPLLGELSMATATRWSFGMGLRDLPAPFVDRMWRDFDPATRRAVLRLYRATDIDTVAREHAPALRALNLPALVVWGQRDPFITPDFAEQQKQVFPRAQIVMLEHCGHWPFANDPGAVAAPVVKFLKEQVGS